MEYSIELHVRLKTYTHTYTHAHKRRLIFYSILKFRVVWDGADFSDNNNIYSVLEVSLCVVTTKGFMCLLPPSLSQGKM